jgi:hypothetical protein
MTSSIDYSPSYDPQHPSLTRTELDRTVSVPREYRELARQILTDHAASFDSSRLRLVVEAALGVLALFFTAALHEPSQPELHDLFEDFLTRCIVGYRTEEAR